MNQIQFQANSANEAFIFLEYASIDADFSMLVNSKNKSVSVQVTCDEDLMALKDLASQNKYDIILRSLQVREDAPKVNILDAANKIVNERSEEKDRQYGSFSKSMDRMRDIFNSMTGHNLSTEDMYTAMIALKMSRQRHAHKEDNLLDAVAYLGALNNYIQNKE